MAEQTVALVEEGDSVEEIIIPQLPDEAGDDSGKAVTYVLIQTADGKQILKPVTLITSADSTSATIAMSPTPNDLAVITEDDGTAAMVAAVKQEVGESIVVDEYATEADIVAEATELLQNSEGNIIFRWDYDSTSAMFAAMSANIHLYPNRANFWETVKNDLQTATGREFSTIQVKQRWSNLQQMKQKVDSGAMSVEDDDDKQKTLEGFNNVKKLIASTKTQNQKDDEPVQQLQVKPDIIIPLREFVWTDELVTDLLDQLERNVDKFVVPGLKRKAAWEDIAKTLSDKYGHSMTPLQCQNKWKNMKAIYLNISSITQEEMVERKLDRVEKILKEMDKEQRTKRAQGQAKSGTGAIFKSWNENLDAIFLRIYKELDQEEDMSKEEFWKRVAERVACSAEEEEGISPPYPNEADCEARWKLLRMVFKRSVASGAKCPFFDDLKELCLDIKVPSSNSDFQAWSVNNYKKLIKYLIDIQSTVPPTSVPFQRVCLLMKSDDCDVTPEECQVKYEELKADYIAQRGIGWYLKDEFEVLMKCPPIVTKRKNPFSKLTASQSKRARVLSMQNSAHNLSTERAQNFISAFKEALCTAAAGLFTHQAGVSAASTNRPRRVRGTMLTQLYDFVEEMQEEDQKFMEEMRRMHKEKVKIYSSILSHLKDMANSS